MNHEDKDTDLRFFFFFGDAEQTAEVNCHRLANHSNIALCTSLIMFVRFERVCVCVCQNVTMEPLYAEQCTKHE